jgi:hypothetical protein
VVGDKGAALPHGPRLACGRVLGRLQLELGVNLGADQNDVERDVEPEQQDDDGAKRSVKLIVVGEVRDVKREGRRGVWSANAGTQAMMAALNLPLWRLPPQRQMALGECGLSLRHGSLVDRSGRATPSAFCSLFVRERSTLRIDRAAITRRPGSISSFP